MKLTPSPKEWLPHVLANFEQFLQDHASCEKKASGMAMNIASHYPDKPKLLSAMADLAVEELSHYREVIRLLLAKGLHPAADEKDHYVRQLNHLIRRGSDLFLVDRLLIAAVIEARGAERFALIAHALPEGRDKIFYNSIATSEARHWKLFIELAGEFATATTLEERLNELVGLEGDIMLSMPIRAALH
jgi:tRNA-(ms[2]io[6]A)-hydroxylase